MSKMDSAKKARLDGWFGRADWQLQYVEKEDSESMLCPKCGQLATFWYITVVAASDLEWIASLTSHRCANVDCDWQRFYYE